MRGKTWLLTAVPQVAVLHLGGVGHVTVFAPVEGRYAPAGPDDLARAARRRAVGRGAPVRPGAVNVFMRLVVFG